jgi:hypothetical protein
MSERSDEREELARALRDANWVGRGCGEAPMPWSQCSQDTKNGYLAAAGVAIARCARVPAEVWDVVDDIKARAADYEARDGVCCEDKADLLRRIVEQLEAALKSVPREPAPQTDVEDESGYTITEADRRFAKDLGFVAPEVLPLHIARFREQNCKPPKQAPRFQVTLDEWAVAWAQWDRKNDKVPLFDALNKELARRPAEPAPSITREHYDTAYQRAVDASVRDEAAVKDALYRELGLGVPAPRALPTPEELRARLRFAAGRTLPEAVTTEVFTLLREHASPADEALRAQCESLKDKLQQVRFHRKQATNALQDAERERDALRRELAEVTGQAEQVEGDLALLRRERDEARAELEHAEQVAVDARDIFRREIEGLKAQLAARPEPVVIDEAFAARVQYAWNTAPGCDAKTMLDALRSVFGEKVSVAGPESENGACVNCLRNLGEYKAAHEAWREACAERDKLRAELQVAQNRLDDYEQRLEPTYCTDADRTGEDLPLGMALRRLSDAAVMAGRELQAAQSDLQLARKAFRRCDVARVRVSEKYEALRALVAVHDSDKDLPGSINMVWYGNRVHDGARALLKPATPEAQSEPGDLFTQLGGHSPAARLAKTEAVQEIMTARLERLERFVNDVHAACEYTGQAAIESIRRAALAMLDAGKQEVGNAG